MNGEAQSKPQSRLKKKNYKSVSVIEPERCIFCESKNFVKTDWRYKCTYYNFIRLHQGISETPIKKRE